MPPFAAANLRLVHCRRPAMASLFEIWLSGEDEEHLSAAGEAALEEIERIERLLSLFDPASEVSRINREAAHRPVRVDIEMFALLGDCIQRWSETGGWFDVTACPAAGPPQTRTNAEPPDALPMSLDAATRTVRLADPMAQINLGGYGKGCALDAAGQILRENGVAAALLHGGTSSVLAIGAPPGAASWRIGLRDPFAGPGEEAENAQPAPIGSVDLADAGLSTSAVFHADGAVSDIIDPKRRQPLREQSACVTIAPTALDAEVWSTALLAMGRASAREVLLQRSRQEAPPLRAAWLSQSGARPDITWLHEETRE